MKVTPLHDRVLVRRIEVEKASKSGIVIPDTAKEKPLQAEVIAVGQGRRDDKGKRVAPEVKRGDKVLVGKYAGTEVIIGGAEYLMVKEDEVLGILE